MTWYQGRKLWGFSGGLGHHHHLVAREPRGPMGLVVETTPTHKVGLPMVFRVETVLFYFMGGTPRMDGRGVKVWGFKV